MKASDLMTTQVATIRPDASIAEAIRIMLQKRISGLPVVNAAGTLVGIVTEGDFLRRSELATQRHRPRWLEFLTGPHRLADEYVHAHARKVEDVMTAEVATVTQDTGVDVIVQLMEKHRIKRLPVLRDGKVVGIVSRANLLHALAPLATKSSPALDHSLANDTLIRNRILAEIDKQKWAPRALVEIAVTDSVVHLRGIVLDEKDRQALRVLAENVPGVESVEDHLEFVPPMPVLVG